MTNLQVGSKYGAKSQLTASIASPPQFAFALSWFTKLIYRILHPEAGSHNCVFDPYCAQISRSLLKEKKKTLQCHKAPSTLVNVNWCACSLYLNILSHSQSAGYQVLLPHTFSNL